MMIDPKRIEKIKEEIFTKYPEFRGVEPKISEKTVKPQEAIYASWSTCAVTPSSRFAEKRAGRWFPG